MNLNIISTNNFSDNSLLAEVALCYWGKARVVVKLERLAALMSAAF